MKKIIEEVLEVEEKVGLELKQARNEASEARLAVEKEVSERIAAANSQARDLIQSAVDQAKVEAEHYREEKLKQTEQGKNAFFSENASKIDSLVDNIANIVLNVDSGRKAD
ncbi:MAG TPA: hypothetical protein PLP05_12250 [Sedimentisphaerales bacterium]|nr:hypothetical protein [Sedimentisphaerales bacterium]